MSSSADDKKISTINKKSRFKVMKDGKICIHRFFIIKKVGGCKLN